MRQAVAPPAPFRCLLVLLAATAAAAAVIAWLLPDLVSLGAAVPSGSVRAGSFDVVLVDVCEIAVAVCAGWLWLGTALVVAGAVRGRPSRPVGVPAGWRRAVLAACGVGLVAGLGTPAHADPRNDKAEASMVEGLPLPERATTSMHVSLVFARAAADQDPDVVVVRPGDTLWDLARADLPADADDEAVTHRVREIHLANRAVIGADPDLIRPHQRLRMPLPTTTREEHR